MRYTRIVLFYVLCAVAVVYARLAQMQYLTEPVSGFFTADGTVAAFLLVGFMVLALGALVVLSLMTRRAPSVAPATSVILSVSALVLAVAVLYDVAFVSYITNALAFVMLTKLCGLLSAAALMLYALQNKISVLSRVSVMVYISLPLFFMFKLVSVFTVYATVSVIASNVITIAFLCSALLFFLYFVKIENSVMAGRSSYTIFPVGMVASIVSLCCVIPQVVLFCIGKSALVHDDPHGMVLALAFAFFCCVYIFSLYSRKNLVHHKRKTHPLAVDTTYHDMSSDFYSGIIPAEKETPSEDTSVSEENQ